MDYSYLNQSFDPTAAAAMPVTSDNSNFVYGDMMTTTNQYMASRGYGPTAAAAAAMRSAYGSPVSQCMANGPGRAAADHHQRAAATAMFASSMNLNSEWS